MKNLTKGGSCAVLINVFISMSNAASSVMDSMDIVLQVRYRLTLIFNIANYKVLRFFMGLIRLIIFALVIWLIWRLVNNFKAKQVNKKQQREKIENQNMVSCQYCSVHVPQGDAKAHEGLWFCSDAHKDKYLDAPS